MGYKPFRIFERQLTMYCITNYTQMHVINNYQTAYIFLLLQCQMLHWNWACTSYRTVISRYSTVSVGPGPGGDTRSLTAGVCAVHRHRLVCTRTIICSDASHTKAKFTYVSRVSCDMMYSSPRLLMKLEVPKHYRSVR